MPQEVTSTSSAVTLDLHSASGRYRVGSAQAVAELVVLIMTVQWFQHNQCHGRSNTTP